MINNYKIILASKSPRRKELLAGLNLPFEVIVHEVDEIFPDGLPMEEIPVYLAKLKAEPFINELKNDTLVITADTIVWIDGVVLGNLMITNMPLRCSDNYRGKACRSNRSLSDNKGEAGCFFSFDGCLV